MDCPDVFSTTIHRQLLEKAIIQVQELRRVAFLAVLNHFWPNVLHETSNESPLSFERSQTAKTTLSKDIHISSTFTPSVII